MASEAPINHIEIVDGKAYIQGRKVKVRMIAGMVIEAGATIQQVMDHYHLSPAEVHAALAYYYDHQAEYEAEDRALQPLIEQVQAESEVRLTRLRARLESIKRNDDEA